MRSRSRSGEESRSKSSSSRISSLWHKKREVRQRLQQKLFDQPVGLFYYSLIQIKLCREKLQYIHGTRTASIMLKPIRERSGWTFYPP